MYFSPQSDVWLIWIGVECLLLCSWFFVVFFLFWGGRFFSSYKTVNLAYVDAVKRRTLPAWIREGLEKMEREKQKKLEKERMEQQRSQMSKKEKKESEEAEEGDGPRLPQKSKFVSRRVCFLLRFVFPERYQFFCLFKREIMYSWLSLRFCCLK